ncbi:hypothetical protein YC2023_094981 [Brassica napus]
MSPNINETWSFQLRDDAYTSQCSITNCLVAIFLSLASRLSLNISSLSCSPKLIIRACLTLWVGLVIREHSGLTLEEVREEVLLLRGSKSVGGGVYVVWIGDAIGLVLGRLNGVGFSTVAVAGVCLAFPSVLRGGVKSGHM